MLSKLSEKENNDCNGDKEFSFTSCVKDYIKLKAGCSLRWFKEDKYPKCNNKSQLLEIKVKICIL